MGLLVKPAPVGAIKRPVRRLLLSRMTPLHPPSPPPLRVPFGRERPGKLCEERRRLSSTTKVFLKIRGTHYTIGNAEERKRRVSGPDGAPRTLVKAAATSLIGCSSHRNCQRSPTRNLARRKYGLMSSFSFLFLFSYTSRSCSFVASFGCRRRPDTFVFFIRRATCGKSNRAFDKSGNSL